MQLNNIKTYKILLTLFYNSQEYFTTFKKFLTSLVKENASINPMKVYQTHIVQHLNIEKISYKL